MPADALSLLSDLQRYAGWLAKDQVSVAVRADVSQLAATIQVGDEVSFCLELLDKDLRRLQGGGVRTMLRRALRDLQIVLEPHPVD